MKLTPTFDSDSLDVFVRVCELQSLTKAASHLGITQAAISQRIAKLEENSGTALLDRSLRPLAPTPAGRLLFTRAQSIIASLRKLELEMNEAAKLPIEAIRIGITDSLGTQLTPEIVPQLRQLSTHLLLRVDSSVNLNRALLERDLDIVVSNEPMSERQNLERFALLRESLILLHSASEPIVEKGVYATIEWLVANRPFLRYASVSPLARQIEIHLRQLSAPPAHTMEFNSSEAIVQMVNCGLGWTVTTPLNLLQARIGLRGLSARELQRGQTRRTTWLLARAGELGDLPMQVAALVNTSLRRTVLRKVAMKLPSLSSAISLPKAPFRAIESEKE